MQKLKVLVTGGAGFIGTNIIKRLLKDGHEVESLDNYTTGLKQNELKDCTYWIGDIQNIYDLATNFDVVFHMAAIGRIQPSFHNPEDYINTNFNGTYEVVKFCTENNIPLIYAGSSSKHSGRYKNPYTFSKDIGEDIIKLYQTHFGLKASVARFYNVYGPYQLLEGDYTTLIGRWLNNIEKGIRCEIYGDGEQRRDFTHVNDIVEALVLIMQKNAYGHEFELGRGQNISLNEIVEMLNINVIYKEGKPGEARNTLCESTLAKEVLGWDPKINLNEYL